MGAAEKQPANTNGTGMIVMMTQDQLRELVGTAVRDAIGKGAGEQPEYLTLDQVCELLQASRRTVRDWVQRDGLPAMKAGAEYRFTRTNIVRWLEERRIKPGVHQTKLDERLQRAK
jgi:excisionase family DNA binding protein